jgi:hypothetical protein
VPLCAHDFRVMSLECNSIGILQCGKRFP